MVGRNAGLAPHRRIEPTGIHLGDLRGEADGGLTGDGGDSVVSGGATNHAERRPSS